MENENIISKFPPPSLGYALYVIFSLESDGLYGNMPGDAAVKGIGDAREANIFKGDAKKLSYEADHPQIAVTRQ